MYPVLDQQTIKDKEQEKAETSRLIERARSGDKEAFGELVKMYRQKACGWANLITKDSNMSEDIVQEALIKAFLHLGKLVDTSRFVPWFRKIVQNQAYMKVRRGGPYRKEAPFSGFQVNDYESTSEIDWSNIDHILFHLSNKVNNDLKFSQDNPEVLLVKKEIYAGIQSLLNCLTQNERNIFEAFFFQQLQPFEIAQMFNTTTANVYNLLSRSKTKVRRERITVYLNNHLNYLIDQGVNKKRILSKPIDF